MENILKVGDFVVSIQFEYNTNIKFEVYESEEAHTNQELFFSGSYVWRGVWEGRIYFELEEYWGEEIDIIANLYNSLIPIFRSMIKSKSDQDDAKFMD